MSGAPAGPVTRARALVVAVLCYAALSGWYYRDLLRAPGSVLPYPIGLSARHEPVHWGDEQMVAATIGIVSRRLLTAPSRIHDLGQCYPVADSLTLGEPMFVDGLVAMVPFALTWNPLVAKNFVTVTAPVLAGLSMFALLLYWTGSFPAAFLAGLLFGFEPARLVDVSHPYVHGNAWTPLAFLGAHRLFARGRWRDAGLLALALALQMLESFYPALALAMVGGVYAGPLAVHHRRTLPSLLPKLAAVALVLGLVGWFAFTPYLETRDTWGVLQGRKSVLLLPSQFHFGGAYYLGTVLVVLATVALLERVRRGAGPVFDPRLPLLVGGALVYWFVVSAIAIPFVGAVPSPYLLGLRELPGVSAVRAVNAVRSALPFVGASLAGFGLAAVLRRSTPHLRPLVGGLAIGLAVAETFFFTRAGTHLGTHHRAVAVKPDASLLALMDSLPAGPVVDFPLSRFVPPTTHYVLLHGFHDRPTAACHSSFPNPMRDEVEAMTLRLPDTRVALQLRTLGFRSIMVHTEFLTPDRLLRFTAWADGAGREYAGLQRLGEADGHVAYALAPGPPPVGVESLALPAREIDRHRQALEAPGENIEFVVRNRGGFYRHPEPLRPDAVVLMWMLDGTVRSSERQTVLLPLALAPGQRQRLRVVPTTLPPPGVYTVELRWRDSHGPVVGRRRVAIPEPRATLDRPVVGGARIG